MEEVHKAVLKEKRVYDNEIVPVSDEIKDHNIVCPDALRHAKTPKCGHIQNTRYTNKISTLHIIYHQKGLVEEILDPGSANQIT